MIVQKDFETTEISISPSSKMTITGSTNVNTFQCRYDMDLTGEGRKIEFT